MANYDILLGADQEAFNRFTRDLYEGFYPVGFRGALEQFGQHGYARVDYDVAASPTFELPRSAPQGEAAGAFTVTLRIPELRLCLHREHDDDHPLSVVCSASGRCQMAPSGEQLNLRLLTLEAHCRDGTLDPETVQAIATALIPGLNGFLAHLALPAITIPGCRFSPPVITFVKGSLIAAYALQVHGKSDAPSALPTTSAGRQFLGISAPTIDAVTAEVLKTYRVSDKTSTEMGAAHLSAEYHLGLANARTQFAGSNELSLTIDASGSGEVAAAMGPLKASFGLRITATPKARAGVSVRDAVIAARVVGVDDFHVKITVSHLPDWLDWAVSRIVEWLAKPVARAIGTLLRRVEIPVSRLNPQTIPINALRSVVVSFADVALASQVTDRPLLVAQGYARVAPAAVPGRIGRAKIDHVVVVMMENRSFDNLAGWLYEAEGNRPPRNIPATGTPTFAGLEKGKYCNYYRKKPYPVTYGAESDTVPDPDPEEQFRFMNEQIFETEAPKEEQEATMGGFIEDYARVEGNKKPEAIMECYSPEQVPVLSALARNYAICDRWFASVPCQTWPNRAFVHAGTSCGRVNNLDKDVDDSTPPDPRYYARASTIFNFLQEVGVSWRVYSEAQDHLPVPSLTRYEFAYRLGDRQFDPNFTTFSAFQRDAASGDLPAYSFVEPNFFKNDFHPPHNVQDGERFLHDVWQAVVHGKCWERTLLIITFDEHGGCYDHVAPPWTAVKPDESPPQKPFGFNRYGVRVPAIVISPYVEPGTVFRAADGEHEYDHTSILRTLRDWVDPTARYAAKMPSSQRIPAAPGLAPVLTRSTPRTDVPDVPAARVSGAVAEPPDSRLNPIQLSLFVAALESCEMTPGDKERVRGSVATRNQALDFLRTMRRN